MDAADRSARLVRVALILGGIAFAGSAALLLSGYRRFPVWLALFGSLSLAMRALARLRRGPG